MPSAGRGVTRLGTPHRLSRPRRVRSTRVNSGLPCVSTTVVRRRALASLKAPRRRGALCDLARPDILLAGSRPPFGAGNIRLAGRRLVRGLRPVRLARPYVLPTGRRPHVVVG